MTLKKMTPEEFVEALEASSVVVRAGLSAGELESLAAEIDAAIPEEMAALYAVCGGIADSDWNGELPAMRLLSASEVIEDYGIHSEEESPYEASREARYFWSDDGSNWAGVFVSGEHLGKVCLLDHNDPSSEPRFNSVSSFLAAIVAAGHEGRDWTELETDF